jgi:protein TonB
MNRMRLGLGVSVALHAAALGLLAWLANAVPPPLDVPPPKGFEIAMNQPTEAAVPVEAAQPPPDTVPPVPPEPEKAVTAAEAPIAREPEVPVVTAREPPAPPKPQPKPKPPPRPIVRRPEPEPQLANLPPALPSPNPPTTQAPAAYAPVAPATPNPDLAAHYRAMLSGWFESHKRYPNSARDAAEQGNAVIRFRVDASGRVLSFGLSKSTGYPDLDRSIDAMMQSATLPAFPPGLTLSYLDVSVTLRYSLTQ